jgi:hypothetical protein
VWDGKSKLEKFFWFWISFGFVGYLRVLMCLSSCIWYFLGVLGSKWVGNQVFFFLQKQKPWLKFLMTFESLRYFFKKKIKRQTTYHKKIKLVQICRFRLKNPTPEPLRLDPSTWVSLLLFIIVCHKYGHWDFYVKNMGKLAFCFSMNIGKLMIRDFYIFFVLNI